MALPLQFDEHYLMRLAALKVLSLCIMKIRIYLCDFNVLAIQL